MSCVFAPNISSHFAAKLTALGLYPQELQYLIEISTAQSSHLNDRTISEITCLDNFDDYTTERAFTNLIYVYTAPTSMWSVQKTERLECYLPWIFDVRC